MESAAPAPAATKSGWPFFILGLVVFFLAPVINAVAFTMEGVKVPWFVLPAVATLGVLLMVVSAWQRGGKLRYGGAAIFGLLCVGAWFMLGVATILPEYQGPARRGQKLPDFNTALADGATFSNKDLEAGKPTLLVFYRGHW